MLGIVLYVGIDARWRTAIRSACDALGVGMAEAADAEAATELLESCSAEVVLGVPDHMDRLRANRPGLAEIILSEQADSRDTIEHIKRGALDCWTYPLPPEEIRTRLGHALQAAESQDNSGAILGSGRNTHGPGVRIVGQSPAMQEVYRHIGLYAPRDIAILITGESGTGKELVAKAVVEHSARFDQPYLAVNCAAIPETLLESELFGHSRGAFTGADTAREGLFARCDGGTLFLDEIGDMPLATQVKLLRVLQDGSYQPLGSSDVRHCNVRILAATHQPLEQLIAERRFRQDLYYRLKVGTIHLPALREREVDVVLLAHYFVGRFNHRLGTTIRGFSPPALSALLAYRWPGNVRELENVLQVAVVRARGSIFLVDFLPPAIREATVQPAAISSSSTPSTITGDANPSQSLQDLLSIWTPSPQQRWSQVMEQVERALIEEALRVNGGQVAQAARWLGISRTTLRKKIADHGLRISIAVVGDEQVGQDGG